MTWEELRVLHPWLPATCEGWRQHANGGGWVKATVETAAYVGPRAIVYGGVMYGGVMRGGEMRGGVMRGGVMHGGVMYGGEMRGGVMRGGAMHGGVMYGGVMYGGVMHGGVMYGGEMRGGAMHGGEMHGGVMHGGAMHGGAMHGGAMHGGVMHGSVIIADGMVVRGHRDLLVIGPLGSRHAYLTLTRTHAATGCFSGTWDELRARLTDDNRADYEAALAMAAARWPAI